VGVADGHYRAAVTSTPGRHVASAWNILTPVGCVLSPSAATILMCTLLSIQVLEYSIEHSHVRFMASTLYKRL